MSSYSGAFQYLDEKGTETQSGPCTITIEPPNLFVIPQGGPSLSIDLGDIDLLDPGDYQLSLKLYTGKSIVLSKFAKTFQNLSAELWQTYTDRLVQCLLLDDLEELQCFEGFVEMRSGNSSISSPAELRLYKSNLAVLSRKTVGFQWRLADIDGIEFNEGAYRLIIRSGNNELSVTKLAKRTGEFIERLRSTTDSVSKNTSAIVRSLCPFLSPDQAMDVSWLMREGRAAAFSKLNGIHPDIEKSLIANAVDPSLKPYFDVLKGKVGGQEWFAGFKLVRPETEADSEPAPVEPSADGSPEGAAQTDTPIKERSSADSAELSVLYWFFFPLKAAAGSAESDVIAWEATSLSGRATYFFKASGMESQESEYDNRLSKVENAVRQINQALVMLNFRREPIYLPDASLQTEARYHRYAIACRKISALRQLRTSYLGRAIHTTVDAWQRQVDAILNKT